MRLALVRIRINFEKLCQPLMLWYYLMFVKDRPNQIFDHNLSAGGLWKHKVAHQMCSIKILFPELDLC